jgi:hypothetical protein
VSSIFKSIDCEPKETVKVPVPNCVSGAKAEDVKHCAKASCVTPTVKVEKLWLVVGINSTALFELVKLVV